MPLISKPRNRAKLSLLKPGIALILLSGCAHAQQSAASNAQAESDERVWQGVQKSMAGTPSTDEPNGSDRPPEQTKPKFMPDAYLMEADLPQLVRQVCGLNLSRVKKWGSGTYADCNAKIRKIYFARLHISYPNADWSEVQTWCDAYPVPCSSDLVAIERTVDASNERQTRQLEIARMEEQNRIRTEQRRNEQIRALELEGQQLRRTNNYLELTDRMGRVFQPPAPRTTNCVPAIGGGVSCTTY